MVLILTVSFDKDNIDSMDHWTAMVGGAEHPEGMPDSAILSLQVLLVKLFLGWFALNYMLFIICIKTLTAMSRLVN